MAGNESRKVTSRRGDSEKVDFAEPEGERRAVEAGPFSSMFRDRGLLAMSRRRFAE